MADKFGIRDILNKYPYQISGGQKQHGSFSTIISKPSLILADEPTGALVRNQQRLVRKFKDLNEQDKATILMVTHDTYGKLL